MNKHDTLLIVSKTPGNRKQLRTVLRERYHLMEAASIPQTLLLIEQNADCIAAILLDITAQESGNINLAGLPTIRKQMEKVPIIVISPDDSSHIVNTAFSYGAADVIPLDYDAHAMLRRIETIVELHLHKQYLETMVEEQANILRHSNETLVDALSSIIEYRSMESGQHIMRIRHFTKILLEEVARCCPEYRLDDLDIDIISSAAVLHDIGKIAIPDSILMKPGPLTPQEREIMQGHALTGCRILDHLGDMGNPEYMRYAYNICHYHHERWDGSGYPDGLVGDEIPICAQVVGLADAYDALTSKRVYKDAYSIDKAVNMILNGDCGIFSPKLLECFKHVTVAYEALAQEYADGTPPEADTFRTTLPKPVIQRENGMERVRAKYNALVHYIDGLLIEVDLNQGLFHLVYNPYPELSWLRQATTFAELESLLIDKLVTPEDREKLIHFFERDVPDFVDRDLRRATYSFHFRNRKFPEGDLFEVALLRTAPMETGRRTLAVLCRRITSAALPDSAQTASILSDSTFLCRNDADFTLIRLGENIHRLAGYRPEELQELFQNRLIELIIPEDREKLRRTYRNQLNQGVTAEAEFRIRHKNGSISWIFDRSRLSIGPDGQEYLNSLLTDITESRKAFEAMSRKLDMYEIILSQTENVLFEWDLIRDTVTLSDTWENIFGAPPIQTGLYSHLFEASPFYPDDLPLLEDCVSALQGGSQYEMVELRISTAWGRYLWCRLRASAVRNPEGGLEKVAGIIINIDAEKQAEQQLHDRASRDSLTRLLNKNAARKQAEEYLSRFSGGADCALLIIDLDNFKQINDRHGHLFGDAVLTRAAREIEKLFRSQDIVARVGGDEFLVLMQGVSDRKLLENRCRQLLQVFTDLVPGQDHSLPLGCSIGVAMSPVHGVTYFDLFNHADQALYQAKATGKNTFVFYNSIENPFPAQASRSLGSNMHIDSDRESSLTGESIVRYAFQQLYSTRDVEGAINSILALIGLQLNVSRVYVFENSDDNRFCSNTYEWCNAGIQPEISNLQHVSYETDLPHYEDNFDEQGIFYCPDVTALPPRTYEIVTSQGIKSMLQCAIRDGDVFRGYIGFDECVEQRLWTKEQIRTLSYFSEMLSLFLMKQRQHEKAISQARQLQSILDNQTACIYIIDPESFQLKYLNARTKQMIPDAALGMCCHKALMDRDTPCPGCPARNIRQKKNNSSFLTNPKLRLDVISEATLIQWEEADACLMTCRKLQMEQKS